LELAEAIASNAPLSNYAILNAVSRIENMSMTEGLSTESLQHDEVVQTLSTTIIVPQKGN